MKIEMNSPRLFFAVCLVGLLGACASPQKKDDSEEMNIRPIFNIQHSTETADTHYELGRYYQGQNRYEQALVSYQKALGMDAKFTRAINGCGVVYALQGKQQEAIEQFRLAIKQTPKAAYLHNNLGYALLLSGSNIEAIHVLRQAVALDASNQSARSNLAQALEKQAAVK